MQILFSVNLMNLMAAESKMALEGRLPEFAADTLEAAMRDKAEKNARSVIGNGGFGQDIAEGIRTRSEGASVTIDHKSNDTNRLAQHVHEGGPIRSPTRPYLAIPLMKNLKEYASAHTWRTPNGKPIVVRVKEDGPHGRAYLAEPQGKRGKLKYLYVLKKETKPQRPRPWWPSDDDFLNLTERELGFWLKKILPETI